MAVAPFLKDREMAAAFVNALNEAHIPMEDFQELVLTNTLTNLIAEEFQV